MTLDPDLQRLADHADRLNGDAVRALIARVQGYRDEAGRVNRYNHRNCVGGFTEVSTSHDHPIDEPIAYYLKETAR